MVFAVDITNNKTVYLLADETEVVNNGYGALAVLFYVKKPDMNAKDKNGHIYANFEARQIVGSYFLDKIKGYRIVSGIDDDEFMVLNRAGIFESMGYEDPLLNDEDEDENGEDYEEAIN